MAHTIIGKVWNYSNLHCEIHTKNTEFWKISVQKIYCIAWKIEELNWLSAIIFQALLIIKYEGKCFRH